MPKYAIRYSDGRATDRTGLPITVNAPNEAGALEHAAVRERERVQKAKKAGVDVVPATAVIVGTVNKQTGQIES